MNADKSTITKAEARLIRVPVDPPRGDAIQKFDALEIPLVTITDKDGNVGTGFGYTIGAGGTSILELINKELLPNLDGEDSRRIAYLHDKLFKSIHALTPGCISSTALAAIDVALWDLAGKRCDTPLYILLGGAKEKVPVYNTHVGWLNRPLDEMVEFCKEAVEKNGFQALKLKVGKDDKYEDEERVRQVREAVGRQTKLMIDANQSWTIDEAVPRLRLLEKFDLVWIEEPLLATDVQGYKKLGFHTRIARAGGESLYSIEYFYQYLREGALDILQPDAARIGGITNAMKVCHLAKAAGLRVAPHVSPELSVTIAAAVTNSMFIEYIPQMNPVLKNHLEIKNGFAIPFEAPGHGIEFDEDALKNYEVKQ
ncbi:MAG: mandelate racemase/muconate lactonizing enzyme family protein [Pyrinomonadaceae bacterium]